MKQKIFSIILTLFMIASICITLPITATAEIDIWDGSVATGFGGGTGTENDPYLIYNGSQLAYLAESVNNGTTYEGKYLKLENDIILNTSDMFSYDEDGIITGAADGKSPNEWTAIGFYNYSTYNNRYFKGVFDGTNHEVKGIYINRPDSVGQGLFGWCRNAQITNLGVTGGYANAYDYVGGIVGLNDVYSASPETATANIEKCYNTSCVCGQYRVGGVVGKSFVFSGTKTTVKNCFNAGNVSGYHSIGGVVGSNHSDFTAAMATIENCYNIGGVSGNYEVGGVAGSNTTTAGTAIISNCNNSGIVFSDSGSSNTGIGGVVGVNYAVTDYTDTEMAIVISCYNTGTVTSTILANAGGIVGINMGAESAIIENCNNSGTVTGFSNTGGVVATNRSGIIVSCYNSGEITGKDGCVGGIAGKCTYDVSDVNPSEIAITNCYNIGAINGVGSHVGGIVGENHKTVTQCYNCGKIVGNGVVGGISGYNKKAVNNCYNTGNIYGSQIGGIIGINYNKSTVSNCYNVGFITGTRGYTGGIIGYNVSEISNVTNNYYLFGCAIDGNETIQNGIGISKKGETNPDTIGSTLGLTNAQLHKQSSFENFDFDTVWTIAGSLNYSYPELIGMEYVGEYNSEYEYVVHFNPNGGTTPVQSKSVINNSFYGSLPVPTKDGYIFKGWFTELDDGLQITGDTQVALTDDQTLYARWQILPYTVSTITKKSNYSIVNIAVHNLDETANIVLATYKNGILSDIQIEEYKSQDLVLATFAPYDTIKVMIWKNLESMNPLTNSEIID